MLATNSQALTLVLGEVYRTISRHLIGKADLTRTTGATGAVTLVQRFGSALNLNVQFHMVFLDGAYQTAGADAPMFHPVPAPESSDLQQLVEQIAGRIGRALERHGLVERDLENAWLATDTEAGPLDLMARLAALVPTPRMHLTRYHAVFAPHNNCRAAVTPAQRGRDAATPPVSGADAVKLSPPRHVAMSWARRLKRVFGKGSAPKPTGGQIFQASHAAPKLGRNIRLVTLKQRWWAALERTGV